MSSTFADSFWSETDNDFEGFALLSKRIKNGKQMFDELADYIQKRIKLELQYGKDLAALGKVTKPCTDSGTSKAAWEIVKEQTAQCGMMHMSFAEELRTNVMQPLDGLRENLKAERKNVEDSVNNAQKKKMSATDSVNKKEKKYHQSCRDEEKAKKDIEDAKVAGSTMKELDKLTQKAFKAKQAKDAASESYKDAVKVLDDARVQWEREMQKCCKTFFRMENQRLTQQRSMLWLTANISSATSVEMDAKQEEIRKALERVSIDGDLEEFIAKNKTGSVKPAPVIYRDYYDTSPQPNKTVKLLTQTTPPSHEPLAKSKSNLKSTRPISTIAGSGAAPRPSPRERPKTTLIQSQWFRAAFAYMPQGPEELALVAGEKVLVLENSQPEWWKAQKEDGRRGMCPAAYLKPL